MTKVQPPRRSSRPHLNIATSRLPHAGWKPTSEQWLEFETAYGYVFPIELRSEIERIINEYLFWQDFENSAPAIASTGKGRAKKTGVQERLNRIGVIAEKLHDELAVCLRDDGAGKAALFGLIKHMPARGDANELRRREERYHLYSEERETLDSVEQREVWDYLTAVSKRRPPRRCTEDVLQRVADILLGVRGYSDELDRIEARRGGFDVQDAWKQAIRDLTHRMDAWGYPAGVSNNDASGTSAFVELLAAIDASLPKEVQQQRNSKSALAQFILRARRRA